MTTYDEPGLVYNTPNLTYVGENSLNPDPQPERGRVRWVAQNVLTGAFIDWALPLTANEPPRRDLSGPGSFIATISPTWDGLRTPDGRPVLEEWSTAVYMDIDGSIRWGGILVNSTFAGQVWQLEFAGFTAYPAEQPYTGTYAPDPGTPDVFDVVRHLWDHLQSLPYGNLGMKVDQHLAGKTVGRAPDPLGGFDQIPDQGTPYRLDWFETPDCGAEIDSLAAETPFDYWEEHVWEGTNSNPRVGHYLHLAFPRVGRRREELRFVQGENIVEVVDAQKLSSAVTTTVIGIGKGEGRTVVTATADVPKQSTLRRARVITDKAIADKDRLAAKCRDNVPLLDMNILIPQITIVDHPNAPIGSFAPGDDILVDAEVSWLGRVQLWHRIVSDTIGVDGRSTLTLVRTEANRVPLADRSLPQEIVNLDHRLASFERASQGGNTAVSAGYFAVANPSPGSLESEKVKVTLNPIDAFGEPVPHARFYTGSLRETQPGEIGARIIGTDDGPRPSIVIASPEIDGDTDRAAMVFHGGAPAGNPLGEFNSSILSGSATDALSFYRFVNTCVSVSNDFGLDLDNDLHAFTLRSPAVDYSMAINHQVIQARQGVAASTLYLNDLGGDVAIFQATPAGGSTLQVGGRLAVTNTAGTSNRAVITQDATLTLTDTSINTRVFLDGATGAFYSAQPGGIPRVQFDNTGITLANSGGGITGEWGSDGSFQSSRMRAVGTRQPGPFAATSTSFTNTGVGITFNAPASGTIVIAVTGRGNFSGAANGVIGYDLRVTGSGSAIHVASDVRGAVLMNSASGSTVGRTTVVGGVPTTGTLTVTAWTRTNIAGVNAEFRDIDIVVWPSP